VVVLGDSVTWGQGLLDEHKLGAIVALALSTEEQQVVVRMHAHSGAVIGTPDLPPESVVGGEVPVALPTILEQVRAFRPSGQEIAVLVNGGINDIDIRRILNPFTDILRLRGLVERYCFGRMGLLLDALRARIETGPILVLGYYPIVSADSNPLRLPFLLNTHGIGTPFFIPHDLVFEKVVALCSAFWHESDTHLQRAVDASNAAAGDERIRFVASGFRPENAVFASQPWLFGLNGDFSPQDEVVDRRRMECVAALQPHDVLGREQCFRASVGHPNVTGSIEYARAIISAFRS
jgi:hypothetical protein